MGRDIPLGRIAGIRIACSWTVVLIALLYTASLAQGQFPQQVPGLSQFEYWAAGAFGALLFFVSLLAHEMGHALVARREGVGVSGIDLWLLGGVAKLESSPETPGAELRISVVGPFTSAAVGLLFLGLHHVMSGDGGTDGLLAVVFAWLGFINLLLAGFNLLPAAPLDGGRVLAALLWMANGDEAAATTTAARVGQVLGALVTAVGAYFTFGGGASGGFWLLLVGFYILSSATNELRRAPLIRAVSGVNVAQVMTPAPAPVPAWSTVEQFLWDIDRSARYDAFPVADLAGRVTGLLTSSVVSHLHPDQWPMLQVSDVAFPLERVLQVRSDAGLLNTLQRLSSNALGDAVVLGADGRIVGLLNLKAAEQALAAQSVPG